MWSSHQSSKYYEIKILLWYPNTRVQKLWGSSTILTIWPNILFFKVLFKCLWFIKKRQSKINIHLEFYISLMNVIQSLALIPPPNHLVETRGQQSSQNCTSLTCIIMQKYKCMCTCKWHHLPMEITWLKVFISRKHKHILVIWLPSCSFHISKQLPL